MKNDSEDFTKNLIEKEIEKINQGQDIIKNMHPAYDEALKAAQLRVAEHDALLKEADENISKAHREEMYRDAALIKPVKFTPVKKVDKPTIINITHPPLVFPEKKKKFYENLPGWIVIGAIGSLFAWLILHFLGFA